MLQALPKGEGRAKRHHRALPRAEVAGAIATVAASDAWIGTKLAFEFVVLTASRSGEARGATWEIDVEAKAWTIPAERMKAKTEHRVLLSPRCLAVLAEARDLPRTGAAGDLVFPSVRGQLSAKAVSRLLRDCGVEAVPHGFRSSFRDWASECTDAPHAVVEAALAHAVRNQVEAAYARSDLFARRRELMDEWAAYVS